MSHATINFSSSSLRRPITINAVFPTDKTIRDDQFIPEKKPMKTIYFLEGMTGNYIGLSNYTRIQSIAEDYNVCVIMIGGENMWFADSQITGNFYDRMVYHDILKYTRNTFNLSDKREDTYIAGFSMGGFGAINIGLRHPDLFSHIVAMSPGLSKDIILAAADDEKSGQGYLADSYRAMYGLKDLADFENSDDDYEYLARKVMEETPELMPRIYLSAGEKDELLGCTTAYYEYLKKLGWKDVTFNLQKGLGHSWQELEESLYKAVTEFLPLDGGFRGNWIEYGPEANYTYDNNAHYAIWYDV